MTAGTEAGRQPGTRRSDSPRRGRRHPAAADPAGWGAGPPSLLVGREDDLATLDALLDRRDVRLVTVTGPVGVGKSRLAAEVVERRVDRGDRALVADLSDARDLRPLGRALAEADPAGHGFAREPLDVLWELFDGEPVLLLLDGVDGITPAGPALAALLAGYPDLTVLATGVRPLRVRGERVLPLGPLGPSGTGGDTEDDEDDPAVALFLARATAADAGFRPDAATLDAVRAVVRACGRLPLAVELAAARVRTVPPATMARELALATAPGVLKEDAEGVPDRHRSMQAALEWTAGLLSPAAGQLLEHAAVFAGPAALDALASVLPRPVPRPELFDIVAELVDVRLVDVTTTDTGDVRVSLPPLVRAFALNRLRENGSEPAARDTHARWFREGCRSDPDLARRAWPDVLAALDHSLLTGRSEEALRTAVAAAARLGDRQDAEESLLSRIDALLVATADADADAGLRARALIWTASHTPADVADLGTHGEWTRRRLSDATALARSAGDDRGLLDTLELTVRAVSLTLDLKGAVAACTEGLHLAARIGDEAALGRFEAYAAMAAAAEGDAGRSADLATSALARGRRCEDAAATAYATTALLALPADRRPELPDLPDLLRRCQAADQPIAALHVLNAMAFEALGAGDLGAASAALARQLAITLDHARSLPFAGVTPLVLLQQVALARGDADEAVRLGAGLDPLRDVLPAISPGFAQTHAATAEALRTLVPADRYAALCADVEGVPLREVLRLALSLARRWARRSGPAHTPAGPDTPPDAGAVAVPLTPREREVLAGLVQGGTNREIAERLGLTAKTVMHHSVSIYRKLGVRGRTEATAWAYRAGVVPPPS